MHCEEDGRLAKLARCEAQRRLRIGELLDALFERSGHHEAGFSSIEAYVIERCQHSGSWGREARGLAKRLRVRGLERIRGAILAGQLTISMAELISRFATSENEAELLEQAMKSTIRAMRVALTGKEQTSAEEEEEEAPQVRDTRFIHDDEVVMLSVSRVLVEYLNGARANDEELFTALLGEAETTLQSIAEQKGASPFDQPFSKKDVENLATRLRDAQAWRAAPASTVAQPIEIEVEAIEDLPVPSDLGELDRELVRCCRELSCRDLEIGRLACRIFDRRSWARWGYRTAAQYATERLGLSLSSIEHRMTLARRAEQFPELARAVDEGVIGYEAALLVSRVVSARGSVELMHAWIERARCRTVKHLREEVAAILFAVGLDQSVSRAPPDAEDLEAVFDIQRKIQSGELLRSYYTVGAPSPQMFMTFTTEKERRALDVKISPELYYHWRNVEAQFRSLAPLEASFIAFMCKALWDTWKPFVEAWDDRWKHIYQRDRHVCTSPVCTRRDATPHHIQFQAEGGTDDPSNVTTVCSQCHLRGIHQGRLRAKGKASKLTWSIGREPLFEVEGREKRSPA